MPDSERSIEFEFVRATENAALNAMRFIGKGEKEQADAAACDAIQGVFDLIDIRGEVVIGEGIKDKAPGIFLGDKLGKWGPQDPIFNIALDPIDGTTNLSKGSPNAISVMAAAEAPAGSPQPVMRNLPSYYSHKVSYGPVVAEFLRREDPQANFLDAPLEETLPRMAQILRKRITDMVVLVLDRPRNQAFVDGVRRCGASCGRSGMGTSRPRWHRPCRIPGLIFMWGSAGRRRECSPPLPCGRWEASFSCACGFPMPRPRPGKCRAYQNQKSKEFIGAGTLFRETARSFPRPALLKAPCFPG